MIRLNPITSSKWVELVPGVSVLMDPIGTVALKEAGASPEVKALSADTHPDVNFVHFVRAVACVVISDWKGVEDEKGDPAPVTHAYITALMDMHPVYQAFVPHVTKALVLVAEKNG